MLSILIHQCQQYKTVIKNRLSCLTSFGQVSPDVVTKVIKSMANKSCLLDPIPTWLLKSCLPELVPIITKIINTTFENGTIPVELKQAIVSPILKKHNLDHQNFKNIRPVSNLAFISKVMEKIVASKLSQYVSTNGLQKPFQSAYTANHSTETALAKVHNDLMHGVDKDGAAMLVLLDLSAAFDTISHSIMVN